METLFHCVLIRSVQEGWSWKGGRDGGDQVKLGSHIVYLHLLIWCISPLLGKLDLCGPSSSPLLEACVFCPIWGLWSLKGPFSLRYLLPDIPHYLRLRWKKEWRVIKLSLQVCCHQRTYWPSRGHRFNIRHQEVSKQSSEMLKLKWRSGIISCWWKDEPTRKPKSLPSRMKILEKMKSPT